jgi:hypothetical protein
MNENLNELKDDEQAIELSNGRAERLVSAIHHHTSEIDRRLNWMCLLQGFLFTTLGFASGENRAPLLLLLPALGISVAALVFKLLACSSRNIHRIHLELQNLKKKVYIPSCYYSEEVGTSEVTLKEYSSSENLFPIVFVVGWVIVLIYAGIVQKPAIAQQLTIVSRFAGSWIWIGFCVVITASFFGREYFIARNANKRMKDEATRA